MSYWSGEKLVERLPTLISPFTVENIDCNSYTLTVGEEVYVTPHHEIKDILSHTKKRLLSSESFSIPPGQFAYLITEEIVSVPSESMAFISMKSTTKFRGLINVSGFHVDPGYHGRLIFAVFNAGPSKLNLQRGQPIFLIWFCDLDRVSSEPYVKTENNQSYDQIPNSFIDNIPGQIHSIRSLHDKIEENRHRIDTLNALVRYFIPLVIAIFVLGAGMIADYFTQFIPRPATEASVMESNRNHNLRKDVQPNTTSDGSGESGAVEKTINE